MTRDLLGEPLRFDRTCVQKTNATCRGELEFAPRAGCSRLGKTSPFTLSASLRRRIEPQRRALLSLKTAQREGPRGGGELSAWSRKTLPVPSTSRYCRWVI